MQYITVIVSFLAVCTPLNADLTTTKRLAELLSLGLPSDYDTNPRYKNNFLSLSSNSTLDKSPSVVVDLPCMSEPFVKYENGSNSTNECLISQFQERNDRGDGEDEESVNSYINDCNHGYAKECFYLGNARWNSPGLQYDYLVDAKNSRIESGEPQYERVIQGVRMANGYLGLMSYFGRTCFDAYWVDHQIYLHAYTCNAYNPNQYWLYERESKTQLIRHAVYTEYCLQVNGYTSPQNPWAVVMRKCDWGILEQQHYLFF